MLLTSQFRIQKERRMLLVGPLIPQQDTVLFPTVSILSNTEAHMGKT